MLETAIRTGDYVEWVRPIFQGGSFFRGRHVGMAQKVGEEILRGIVVRHSYGPTTHQHTFTIQLENGQKKLVKGRNLYPNLIEHRPDFNSPDRQEQEP